MARVTKYRTMLDVDGRAVLEKEAAFNCPDVDKKLITPTAVEKLAKNFLRMHELPEEHMYMLVLNNKLVLTGIMEISHGNVNSSIVGPREVFQKALLANAVNIMLLHNHPSGDPTPSMEDIKVTERLVEAGKLLGIQVVEHMVIGQTCVSLREKGYIK